MTRSPLPARILIPVANPLTAEELVHVLTGTRNAMIKQYRKLFAMDGVNLEVTPDALVGKRIIKNTRIPVKVLGGGELAARGNLQRGPVGRGLRDFLRDGLELVAAGGAELLQLPFEGFALVVFLFREGLVELGELLLHAVWQGLGVARGFFPEFPA